MGADEDKQEPDGLKIGSVLSNYSSGSSVSREDRLDRGFEVWKVMLDDGPHDISINAEIHVDEDIAHPADLAPRNLRMSMPVILRNSSCSFTDDLQMMNHPGLN